MFVFKLVERKAGTSKLHVGYYELRQFLKLKCQQRQSRRQTSMFTVCGATAERLLFTIYPAECEGNGFPLHTIFLRDHTHFARLLTFTKSRLNRL